MDKKPRRPAPKNAKSKGMKNAGFIAIIVLLALILLAYYNQPSNLKEVPFTQAVSEANGGKYSKIDVKTNELTITKKGENVPSLRTNIDSNSSLAEQGFKLDKVNVTYQPATNGNSAWIAFGSTLIPVILIGALLIFMMRSAQGQGNQAMSFGKSRARLYGNEKDKVTFASIAGSDEAKQDLAEVVEFLKFPKKFASLGARIPKGVLLVG